MDESTILKIIAMLDNSIKSEFDHSDEQFYSNLYSYRLGRMDVYHELGKHLQSFIEETEFPDPKSACSACGSHDPDHLCEL